MPNRKHIVITGTGRAGTTFLVELFTALSIDTGFTTEDIPKMKNQVARAGLEHDIHDENCPYLVKSPHFCDHAADILHRDDVIIEHVFIPMRELHAAAESRRFVTRKHEEQMSFFKKLRYKLKKKSLAGGLAYTQSKEAGTQENILLNQVYKLLLALSDVDVPVTLLHFPLMTKDGEYLYRKLRSVLNDIDLESFMTAYRQVVRPDLVHNFSKGNQ